MIMLKVEHHYRGFGPGQNCVYQISVDCWILGNRGASSGFHHCDGEAFDLFDFDLYGL
jgi:hypothetical protein